MRRRPSRARAWQTHTGRGGPWRIAGVVARQQCDLPLMRARQATSRDAAMSIQSQLSTSQIWCQRRGQPEYILSGFSDRWHCRAVTRGPNASNRRSNSPKIGAQALVMTSTPSPRRSASPCRRLSFVKLESAGLRHSTKDSPHVLLGVERHGAQRRGRAACHGGLLAHHEPLVLARRGRGGGRRRARRLRPLDRFCLGQ